MAFEQRTAAEIAEMVKTDLERMGIHAFVQVNRCPTYG
jgi:hypothetical protein